MKKTLIFLLLFSLIILHANAQEPVQGTIIIDSLSPDSGPAGTSVTISESGFSLSSHTIYFGPEGDSFWLNQITAVSSDGPLLPLQYHHILIHPAIMMTLHALLRPPR
jgi:hypothetical protein